VKREAAIGYLIRIAAKNGYETPRQLWTALQIHGQADVLNALCARLHLSADEKHYIFGVFPSYCGIPFQQNGLVSADFNHSLLRWCPLCLNTSKHMHGAWGLKLCCACTSHGVLLCERCPFCKQAQRLERADIGRCHCGGKLDAAPAVPAPKALLCVANALEMAAFSGCITTAFPKLGAAAWHRIIRYLGQFSETRQAERPGQIAGLHRLDIAIPIISATGRLLDNWPDNFHVMLTAIHRLESNSPSVPRTFGSLYRVLYFHLREPCFQFLRDAFEDYLHLNWWGIICKRNRSFKINTIFRHPQLTTTQAAIKAGTEPAIVKHLIRAEVITSSEATLPSGRKAHTIHQNQVADIAALTRDGVTLADAAFLLALPKIRVRELIDGGIITPLISRPKNRAASWLIPLAQLQRLSFKPIAAGSDDNCLVAMKWILQFWRLRKGEFAAIGLALTNGEIVPVAKQIQATAIGDLLLDFTHVHEWLKSYRMQLNDSMSVDRASKMLGVKQQVAYELVRIGLLRATNDGPHGKRVGQQDIRYFQETYVALAELARLSRHSPKKILEEIIVRPVCGPSVDGTRQYFFRRLDLDAVESSFVKEPWCLIKASSA